MGAHCFHPREAPMSTLVSYELQQSIATIRMDDGKVNALSPAMQSQLNAALDQAEAAGAVVVLAGRAGVFSAGFDLKVLRRADAESLAMLQGGFELALRLFAFPAPVVIACTGHALAMAAFLLLSGDVRIGAEGDFKIGANEVAIGMTVPHIAVELCRQRLTPGHFQRALMNAEIYAPTQAVAAGFLDHAVATADLPAAAHAAAAALVKLDRPAYVATKQRVRAQALQAMREALVIDGLQRTA
jgi:enoyl-CoA hydratase